MVPRSLVLVLLGLNIAVEAKSSSSSSNSKSDCSSSSNNNINFWNPASSSSSRCSNSTDSSSSGFYQANNINVRPITCQGQSSDSSQPNNYAFKQTESNDKNSGHYLKYCPQNCNQHDSSSSSSSSSEKSLAGPAYRFDEMNINLQADVGFYSFYFSGGNAGTTAYQTFYFYYGYPVKLTLFDCYCGGDRFRVTSGTDVYSATGCSFDPPACQFLSTDPYTCLMNVGNGWCQTSFVVQSGYTNISIGVLASPYGAGTGFIMLQSYCGTQPCCQLSQDCIYDIYM